MRQGQAAFAAALTKEVQGAGGAGGGGGGGGGLGQLLGTLTIGFPLSKTLKKRTSSCQMGASPSAASTVTPKIR